MQPNYFNLATASKNLRDNEQRCHDSNGKMSPLSVHLHCQPRRLLPSVSREKQFRYERPVSLNFPTVLKCECLNRRKGSI